MKEVKEPQTISEDLFSVIVLHYNQQDYIEEALDSVFAQDYKNIELIIADDASFDLDENRIKAYVEEHRSDNISSALYLLSAENVGTVRNVNRALREASGKYIMFFAADDALYDSHVISNFAAALSKLPPDQYMVCAQCIMMDEELDEIQGDFVNVPLAFSMNEGSALDQFRKLAFSCCYAVGATAFKREMLEEKGYFDETYKIIEDWSYYLSLTLSGSKIIYVDFNALKHRDGGVSHFNQEVLPPHVVEYKNDSLLIQERLLLPHLSLFSLPDQVKLMHRYECERSAFEKLYTGKPRPSRFRLIMEHKRFYAHKLVWWLMDNGPRLRRACLSAAKWLLLIWAVLRMARAAEMALLPGQRWVLLDTEIFRIATDILFILLIVAAAAWTGFALAGAFLAIRRWIKRFFGSSH